MLDKSFFNPRSNKFTKNNDVDSYRTTVKRQIKDWHSVVTARKNQEWLILHIVRPETRAQGGNFFQLKGSVFEKIRTDFNTERRERFVFSSRFYAYLTTI